MKTWIMTPSFLPTFLFYNNFSSKRVIYGLAILLFIIQFGYSQKTTNNWVINNFRLDFNDENVAVKRDVADINNWGTGVVSDETGNLLFYTDGNAVWNQNHELMPNSENLISPDLGPNTRESIIIPKPGTNNIYYIFSVSPGNGSTAGLYYSTVDISLSGGLGAVTTKGTKLIENTSSKLNATLHKNQKDVWLMVHKNNTNRYFSILISEDGISSSHIEQEIGRTHDSGGQLKFAPDGNKMACSYYIGGGQGFDLFDFDSSSGKLSNPRNFIMPERGCQGLEFSSDATKLYVYQSGSSHEQMLFQYDLTIPTYEAIQESRIPLYRERYNSFRQMQLASDGKIYITKGGGGGGIEYLGIIQHPNRRGKAAEVIENGLYLEGGNNFASYTPNFIQNHFFKTSFRLENPCRNTETKFYITNHHRLDSVKWYFGEGSSSTSLTPEFNYTEAGEYMVKLVAFYPEKIDTITRKITIHPTSTIDLGIDTTVCFDHKLSVAKGFKSYAWNTGDTSRFLRIQNTGWYSITVENDNDCFFTDSILIDVEALPIINMPDTLEIGDADSLKLYPGDFQSYDWNTGEETSSIYAKKQGWYSVIVENKATCQSDHSIYVAKYKVAPEKEEWEYLNPQPSGRRARDMYFIDERVGFIINGKDLLKTTNGGEKWEIVDQIKEGNKITFKSGIGYIITSDGNIYKSTYNGKGWNKLNFPFGGDLNSINLLHQDTLMVTSGGTLFISNDGGDLWKQISLNIKVIGSFFTDTKTGHIISEDGKIYKTKDGGNTWYETTDSGTYSFDFIKIYFANENLGFASHEFRNTYKTADGGETWSSLPSHIGTIHAFHFLNNSEGFIANEFGKIYKTLDGGDTWSLIRNRVSNYSYRLNSIFFTDENTGHGAGELGRIGKTSNGGSIWREYSPTYNKINQLSFTSKDTAYAISRSKVLKTVNKGRNWIDVKMPLEDGTIHSFDFVNSQTGFIAINDRYSPFMLKSINGGIEWSYFYDFRTSFDEINAIEFIDENIGFVSGDSHWNKVLKTIDGGITWFNVDASTSFNQIQFINHQIGYATNRSYDTKMYKTEDGGDTWGLIFESDNDIEHFHFTNENTGYFVGRKVMHKTTDGGGSWKELEVPYEDYEFVQFYSNNIGYMLDDYGRLYETLDGGLNWENIYRSYGIESIELTSNNIYIYGDFGSILRSDLDISVPNIDFLSLNTCTRPYSASFEPIPNAVGYEIKITVLGQNGKVITRRIKESEIVGNFNVPRKLLGTEVEIQIAAVFEDEETGIEEIGEYSEKGTFLLGCDEEGNLVLENRSTLDFEIQLTPNPAQSELQFQFKSLAITFAELSIIDLTGKVILAQTLSLFEGQNSNSINIAHLPKGQYFLQIQTEAGTQQAKFIKL